MIVTASALGAATAAAAVFPHSAVFRTTAGDLPHLWASPISIVVTALAIAGLVELTRMLRVVEQGSLFAPSTTRHFRRFALLLMLSTAANILLPPLTQLGIAFRLGTGRVAVSIDDGGLLALILGVLLFLVAKLFGEAARLEEDSRAII